MPDKSVVSDSCVDRTHLVVLLHGWSSFGQYPDSFVQFAKESFPDACTYAPQLELSLFSTTDILKSVDEILEEISKKHEESGGKIKRITIIGYSAGTLFARALTLRANGYSVLGKEAKYPDGLPWAKNIKHLVMISGILRGWTISSATPKLQRFCSGLLRLVYHAVSFLKREDTFIQSVERGRPLVVALRLGFLDLMRLSKAPKVTYLLGSSDEYISPADAIDMRPSDDVRFFQLPRTNHFHALTVGKREEKSRVLGFVKRLLPNNTASSDGLASTGLRKQIYTGIFEQNFASISEYELSQSDIDDYLEPLDRHQTVPVDDSIEHAVIILHGIRDEGFWTKRIAREVKKLGEGNVVRAPSPSYGYFSMWNFLNKGSRLRKCYWLMEQYADIKTYFPEADISFVGHSNGTYLGTKAMIICPEIKFKRMYLAGSVVRRNFEWQSVDEQVSQVVNVTASRDVVVACFPGLFEKLGLRSFLDVGGAGDTGFVSQDKNEKVVNVGPLKGGHSTGISENRWQSIAKFIIDGEEPGIAPTERSGATIFAYRCCFLLAVIAIFAGAVFVGNQTWHELEGAGYLVGYFFLVWLFWRFIKFF